MLGNGNDMYASQQIGMVLYLQIVQTNAGTDAEHSAIVVLQVITRVASTRVAEYAFKYASDNGRNKVTAVHKANIMKMADGLFIKCCREGMQVCYT